jgi:hypothetical protein
MRTIQLPGAPGIFLCLTLWYSGVAAESLQRRLPAEVAINKDAGRGNFLFVTLRLENGQELPFMIDTGAPDTLFDKSLEPQLGKPLGTETNWFLENGQDRESRSYSEPKLYLGGAPLTTGARIITCDCSLLSRRCGRPVLGCLGMDCLKNYCIQLDFQAGKMRFLDPGQTNAAGLGKAFPLTISDDHPFIHRGSLIGGAGANLEIDTGFNIDGAIKSRLFWRQFWGFHARIGPHFWKVLRFRRCVWDGATYTNLSIGKVPGWYPNLIGLRFLARHLVTFDFPNHMMYLKQTSVGPVANQQTQPRPDR